MYGRYELRQSAFGLLPGNPISYWISRAALKCFSSGHHLYSKAPAKLGMRTGDNGKWLRKWFEVSSVTSKYDAQKSSDAVSSGAAWFPYNKGGEYRKWYGNNENVIFWKNNGADIKTETLRKYPQLSWEKLGWKITNEQDFFKPSCTWTFVSSSLFGV